MLREIGKPIGIAMRIDSFADERTRLFSEAAPKTKIGKVASKKHWFADLAGPWSEPLAKEAEAADARQR